MPYRPPPEVLARLRSDVSCPAYIGSDCRLFSGGVDGFGDDNRSRQLARHNAAEAGVSVSGAKYFPSLAKSAGDPEAWMRDRSDISRRATELGVGIEAPGFHIAQPVVEVPDDKPYKVADDIVEKELEIVVDKEHGGHIKPEKRKELFHEIQAKRSDVLF